MKSEVLVAIGETGLSTSAAVNAALAANERIKYLLSLLQLAAMHADHPDQPATNLKQERIACGIDDTTLDGFTGGARPRGDTYQMPGLDRVLTRIAQDLKIMAAPVSQSGAADVATRLGTVLASLPPASGNRLDAAALEAMSTASPPSGSDSLHRLVMDLHRALNALQASLAEETIDGAAAYGLAADDRPRVAAFMAGINRTARLKFDHPGPRHHRDALRRNPGAAERHRYHGRACRGHPCRGIGRPRHLYRRTRTAAGILPGHARPMLCRVGDHARRQDRRWHRVPPGCRAGGCDG